MPTLNKKGEMVLYGSVGGGIFSKGFSDKDVISDLAELTGDITVRVNSGGGDAFQGVAIYNALKAYNGKVTIKVDGLAASAASIIAMAGDTVEMGEGSQLMIHNASAITMGTAEDHAKQIEMLQNVDKSMARIYAAKTGMKYNEVKSMMDEETWIMADEAVKKKFANNVAKYGNDDDEDINASATLFDYRIYKHAPRELVAMAAAHFRNAPDAERSFNKERLDVSAVSPNGETNAMDIKTLTVAALRDQRADLVKEIEAAFEAGFASKIEAARKEGAENENKRIQSLEACALPGYEKILAEHKANLSKTDRDLSVAIITAEKELRGQTKKKVEDTDDKLSDLGATAGSSSTGKKPNVDPTLTGEAKAKAEYAADPSLAESGITEAAYIAFSKFQSEGRVRVFAPGASN